MNILIEVALTTVLGAALFFAAGVFLERRRRAPSFGLPLPAPREAAKEDEEAQSEELPPLLPVPAPSPSVLEGELKAELDAQRAASATLRQSQDHLRRQLEATKLQLADAERKATDGKTQVMNADLHRALRDAELARGERDALQREVEGLRGELSVAVSRDILESIERELAVRAELATRYQEEASLAREENAALKVRMDDEQRLSSEVRALQEENRELRRQAVVSAVAPQTQVPQLGDRATHGEALQFVADSLVNGGARCAAVTDELGLPVAGSGELAEALAAYGSLLADVATRGQKILPFGLATRITLEDDLRLSVSARRIDAQGAGLWVVTLGSGPQQDEAHIDQLLAKTPGLPTNPSLPT